MARVMLPFVLFLLSTVAAQAEEAKALIDSAIAKIDKGDFKGAVDDLSRAIELDPANAIAYKTRGLAHHQMDEFQTAIEDYTRALAIDPTMVLAYNNRANALRSIGKFPEAHADCDKAIEIDPKFEWAYINRGTVRYLLGDLGGAKADLTAALGLGATYADYTSLWLWAIDAKTMRAEMATKTITDWLATRKGKPEDWPARLGAYLVGTLSEEDLMKEASSVESEATQRQCEAGFYVGMNYRLHGDTNKAKAALKASVGTGRVGFFEYQAAKVDWEEMKNARK